MVSIKRWSVTDIWDYGRVNIDKWTENYSISFYLYYTIQWPSMHFTLRNNSDKIIGYILGSAGEDNKKPDHGHITAVSVSEDYRRLGLATFLVKMLEEVSINKYNAYFVDLYVRPTNQNAQNLYHKMGYIVYRRIIKYYSTLDEDGLDMRKSMPRDKTGEYSKPLPKPVRAEDVL